MDSTEDLLDLLLGTVEKMLIHQCEKNPDDSRHLLSMMSTAITAGPSASTFRRVRCWTLDLWEVTHCPWCGVELPKEVRT